MKKKIYIKDLIDYTGRIDLQLSLIAGKAGLHKEIIVGDINRPGLSLAGFFDYFAFDRIQIFGLGEAAYINQLEEERKNDIYEKFFSYDVLCCIFTYGKKPDDLFIKFADKKKVPTFTTQRRTTKFVTLFSHVTEEAFAPFVTIHGSMVDVFGVGVILLGKSGVGKSECALELVERGHRLIGDDILKIQLIDESLLIASGSSIIKHHMEIRGLGIINIKDIFGIRSLRERKRVELIAMLEEWDHSKQYDRLGIEEKTYSILDINTPYITVPVKPGRNIPIIIETAALNRRLKKMGISSAKELDDRIKNWIQMEKLQEDD